MFIEYATKQDLAEYMGKKAEDLPQGSEIMLRRASEIIGMSMRKNYNPEYESHREAAKLAVCAQCQFWIENELSPVEGKGVSSYSLGELSVTYSDVENFSNKICKTSLRYLCYKYLLYKGMR